MGEGRGEGVQQAGTSHLVGYSSSSSVDTRKGKGLSRVDIVEIRGPFGDYKIMMPVTWFEVEEDSDYAD
jgi:hypothetical protein